MKFQPHQSLPLRTLLVVALSSVFSAQAFAAAGTAQFTAGDVQLKRADGGLAPLAKGREVDSGQSVVTGSDGRAQVRFTDGGVVSLQPNTEFKIANYVDKLDGKEDRFLVDLLRGSMRAITGLIGKRNRDNYRVTTTTATIGIRGSGFTAGYNPDGSLGVTAEKDAIEVCNAGVCVGLVAGESVRVIDKLTPPSRTVNKAAVPTPGRSQDTLVAGNQTNNAGISNLVPTQPLEERTTPPTGSYSNLNVTSYHGIGVSRDSTADSELGVTLDAGILKSYTVSNSTDRFSALNGAVGGYAGSFGDESFVGWGYWATGKRVPNAPGLSPDNLHYVVGIPTPDMPTSGGPVNYQFTGASAPTLTSNGNAGSINPSLSSFSVDFSQSFFSYVVTTSFGTVQATNQTFSGNRLSSTSSSGSMTGFFAGPDARYAAFVYRGFSPSTSTPQFSGSIVFQKLTP